jgi:hypothetical protein
MRDVSLSEGEEFRWTGSNRFYRAKKPPVGKERGWMPLDHINKRELNQLFRAILSLKTVDECYQFFDDLCTVGEIKAFAQRTPTTRSKWKREPAQRPSPV